MEGLAQVCGRRARSSRLLHCSLLRSSHFSDFTETKFSGEGFAPFHCRISEGELLTKHLFWV